MNLFLAVPSTMSTTQGTVLNSVPPQSWRLSQRSETSCSQQGLHQLVPEMGSVKFLDHFWNKTCAQVAVALLTRSDMSLALASGPATCCFWRVKICVKSLGCLEQKCCLVLFLQFWKTIFFLQGRGLTQGKYHLQATVN